MNGCLGPLGKRCWRCGICRKGIKWCETAGGRRGEWGQGFSCNLGALPSAREPGLGTIPTGPRRCPRGRGHGVRAGPGVSWAGRGGWGHLELLWLPPRGAGGSWRGAQRGLSLPGTRPPPARALLTAVRDVAHDVSGDPQLLHVARSQGGLLGHPPRAHPGFLGVPVAEEAPHDGGYGPRCGGAPMHVGQPESLEQGGGGAWGRWGAGWGQ